MWIVAMHGISRMLALFLYLNGIPVLALPLALADWYQIVARWVLLWEGRVPGLKYPILELSDLALNGYMLAKPKQCLALKQFGAFYVHVAHWRDRLGRDIYYTDCRHKTTARCCWYSVENLLSLLQRSILKTDITLMAILPTVRFGNVQRCDLPLSNLDHRAPIIRSFNTTQVAWIWSICSWQVIHPCHVDEMESVNFLLVQRALSLSGWKSWWFSGHFFEVCAKC
jgi:hypothetical protein